MTSFAASYELGSQFRFGVVPIPNCGDLTQNSQTSQALKPLIQALVERFDAVKFGTFQRKSSNFRELVLFCIEADFCDQILIF